MAKDKQYEEMVNTEADAVKESSKKYDDLIATLILISTSNRPKREKFLMIEKEAEKMRDFNAEFAQRKIEDTYAKFSKEAAKDIGEIKKKLTAGEESEAKNLAQKLEISLKKRVDVLINQAKELVTKEELAKIRESKLGMTDGTDKVQITPKKTKPDLVFIDSKGRKVTMDAVMKITVGDNIWETIFDSKRAVYLEYGFRYAKHISVLDDKTTDICLALDQTVRDLTKDKIPPMHPNCRSRIKIITDPTFKP